MPQRPGPIALAERDPKATKKTGLQNHAFGQDVPL